VTGTVHLGSVTEYDVEVGDRTFLATDLGAPQYESGDEVAVSFADYGLVEG
jgi:hypothetical protein